MTAQVGKVFDRSQDAMEAILGLHFPEGSIVDVNFGLGVFYRNGLRKRVTGVDIIQTGDVDVIADNKALPFASDSFDLAVCDPPYKRGDGKKYQSRYGVAPKTETQVTWSYHAAIEECLRVARSGLIIKVQDGTDGHKFHPRHVQIAEWMR